MTLVGCSNTTADKDKVNVGNSDTKVADNGEVSAEKDKSSKKYSPPYYFNRIIIPKIITRIQKIIKQHLPKYKRVDYHTNQTPNTQQ